MAATPSTPTKRTLLKRAAETRGLPYESARYAAFRGEFRVFRSGIGERYSRWLRYAGSAIGKTAELVEVSPLRGDSRPAWHSTFARAL